MNAGQVYRILEGITYSLKLSFYEYKDKEKDYDYLFYSLDNYNKSLNIVKKYAPFLIDSDEQTELNNLSDPDPIFPSITAKKAVGVNIIAASERVRERVIDYVNYLESLMRVNVNENTLIVEFNHIKDLDEFEKTLGQLKRALNTPVYELGGRTEILTVESGSIIIDILIHGGVVAAAGTILKMIGALLHSAVETKNEYHKGELFAQQAKMLGIKNEMLQEIVNRVKTEHKKKKNLEANKILEEYAPNQNTSENIESFKDSIEMFGVLLEKGAQFYPSISAPEEAKKLFPNAESQKLIQQAQKSLENGQANDEESGIPDNE